MGKIKVFALWTAPAPYSVAWLSRLAQQTQIDLLVAYQHSVNLGHAYWNLHLPYRNISFNSSGILKGLLTVPKILSVLSRFRPDVVFFGNPVWPIISKMLWLWCLLTGTPYTFLGDGNAKKPMSWWKHLRNKVFITPFIRFAQRVVVIGTNNQSLYRRYGSIPQKEVFAPYSVDTDFWLVQAETTLKRRDEIRQRLGVNDETTVFLYVGKLEDVKGVDTLIEASALLQKRSGKKFKLLLVGTGSREAELKDLARNREIEQIVNFCGKKQQNELADYYASADWFVLPSRTEAWGLVINEALCFGLPVIASDAVGAVEDLVKDGVNGFVFIKDEVESLLEALEKAINTEGEQRKRMREEARKVIDQWNIKSMVGGLLQAVTECCNFARRHPKEKSDT